SVHRSPDCGAAGLILFPLACSKKKVYKSGLGGGIIHSDPAMFAKEGIVATSAMSTVLHHLRRAALLRDGAGLPDGQLLESFLAQNDEVAFEALVRRHGPMVMGVCRRLLRNPCDAEDAFQATFLVLVRKAATIVPPDR